ncbi:hypothetical protein BG262_05960 [Floricoccus penangensis]|uniref:DNA/RNA non-specific endonuclease domain-containing protein n=1 Tax=Floricoccus penangensis TaxID=1859475 RepID=A0A9Q5NZP8_9LACT|nr:hypothetical protein [Floricoccus penangensis]OFI46028.1 hypothetical protein BG262_05960 [Floricoccus penangensis]
MGSERYSRDLKPNKYAIERTYQDFPDLEKLLNDSEKKEGGYYILNKGKWFEGIKLPSFLNDSEKKEGRYYILNEGKWFEVTKLPSFLNNSEKKEGGYYILNEGKWFEVTKLPSFFDFEIENDSNNSLYLKRNKVLKQINVKLQKSIFRIKIKRDADNIVIDDKSNINWRKNPKSVYGLNNIPNDEKNFFHKGHIIGDLLISYTDNFDYYKWENYVMITEWCNCAETFNENKKACGMKFFEKIIKDSLDDGARIDYRVTPVFNKKGSGYEVLPRGIILEAKIINNKTFFAPVESELNNKKTFNVFIPNAQSNLKINYSNGIIYQSIN